MAFSVRPPRRQENLKVFILGVLNRVFTELDVTTSLECPSFRNCLDKAHLIKVGLLSCAFTEHEVARLNLQCVSLIKRKVTAIGSCALLTKF